MIRSSINCEKIRDFSSSLESYHHHTASSVTLSTPPLVRGERIFFSTCKLSVHTLPGKETILSHLTLIKNSNHLYTAFKHAIDESVEDMTGV